MINPLFLFTLAFMSVDFFLFSDIKEIDYVQKGWGKTEHVWNLGLASNCDLPPNPDPYKFFREYPSFHSVSSLENLKEGDSIWIRCVFFSEFCQNLFHIKVPIVLVICDEDESFPSSCKKADLETALSNENIIHIFAQNCDYKGLSTKISHLPIGIDFHSIAYKNGYWGEQGSPEEQEVQLKQILSELLPTHERKCRALVDFYLADSMRYGHCQRYLECGEDRTSIFNQLKTTHCVDASPSAKRSDLWRAKGQYAFSISPHGNGLDCHRTWEDLVLGCIVIVKTSPLDPLYEGLPVVIVNDWLEVNEENMKLWLDKYGDAFTNSEYRQKLKTKYWLNKIKNPLENQ